MQYSPTFEEFTELAKLGSVVPVYRQLMGDTLTPVTAFHILSGFREMEPETDETSRADWNFLFESVIGGERIGRYSFLGAEPFLTFQAYGNKVLIQDLRTPSQPPVEQEHPDPIRLLEETLQTYRAPSVPGLPRFSGGAVGYAGYDSVRYVEHLPKAPHDDRRLPDLCFAFYDRMIIFDHINKTIAIVAQAHIDPNDLRSSYEKACRRVDGLVRKLQTQRVELPLTDIAPAGEASLKFTSNYTRKEFETHVERCQEYIRAGDIFQVVLSQRLEVPISASPFDIYRTLRVVNPSPFMFHLKAGSFHLVGSSPEIMVRVEGDQVTIRPLAGTRRRGKNYEEDDRLAADLLSDEKERAEHIMLVDLGRNDVGRVARFNTVQLSDVMVVELYSHVMHISSNVTGQLREDMTAFDALRSCLPAGTLSGAPKVRAMEIIDELEPHRRGPYGGAVGYIDFSGNMDTCIALRTLVLKDNMAYIQAGAGLVYDSVPANEWQETLNKAMGMLKALEIAEKQTHR